MTAIPENIWNLARTLHDSRMKACYGNMRAASRRYWPDATVTRQNYGHNPEPHVDLAIAQAKAAFKHFGIDPNSVEISK